MSALVKSGHWSTSAACPLYPQKRTLIERVGMSTLCQKQTLPDYSITSSARESTLFGIAKFIAFAVFILTTNR
jgi:hypothetical protein